MQTEETLGKKLEAIHTEAVETIITHIDRIKQIISDNIGDDEDVTDYSEIMLYNPVLNQYIDDQINEVVTSVHFDKEKVTIDCNYDDDTILLNQLSTTVLIAIVGELEAFETFDDVQHQLY